MTANWCRVVFITAFWMISGAGYSMTGDVLLQNCSAALKTLDGAKPSPDEDLIGAHCMGYIVGIIEGHEFMVSQANAVRRFCPPENLSTPQSVRVVVKYLRSNPEFLHLSSTVLVLRGLHDAFPCR